MRRGAVVFAAWGLWLGAWTAVQLVFAHAAFPERTIQWVMLGGASAARDRNRRRGLAARARARYASTEGTADCG